MGKNWEKRLLNIIFKTKMRTSLLLLLVLAAVARANDVYESDKDTVLEAAFDAEEPVFDLELHFEPDEGHEAPADKTEYGYGLWARWSRTSPKLLQEKANWHSLIRLTTNENHGNERNPGDRTLVIWLGRGKWS